MTNINFLLTISIHDQEVMRILEMITKGKVLRSFVKFSQGIFIGNVWRSIWRICIWILELKGLKKSLMVVFFKGQFGPVSDRILPSETRFCVHIS